MTETALTVHQTARPHGFPAADHFTFAESPLPEPSAGSALVENLYWSVDPYHREMMDDLPGGFALGLLENYGATVFGGQWKDVFAFTVLVLVLLFRPSGLLGETLGRARA